MRVPRQLLLTRRTPRLAFGREFLANPDLPRRLRENASLNEPSQETFYGGGAEG